MANDIPDFRTHTPAVDPQAFANVLQRKREEENQQARLDQQRKDKRFTDILQAIQTGQQIASGMMTLAEKHHQLQDQKIATAGQAKVQEILNSPEPQAPSPTASSSVIPEAGTFKVQPSPEQNQSYQDALVKRKNDLSAALIQADRKGVADVMAKNQFANPSSADKRFQQSALEITDAQGRPITVTTTFDTVTGKQINPMTGQEIKTVEDAKDLLKRGYAQSTRSAGYTSDGQEIVEDTRTGGKFVTSIGADGKQSNVPYNGSIYPKLENPPATFTASLAELGNAQQLLTTITKSFDSKYVGPIAAKAGKMTKYIESLSNDKKVEFYGNVAEYKNSIIKAITGAQMSEVEAKRIIQQIPDENSSPTAFLAGVKRSYLMTDRKLNEMQKAINRTGSVVRGDNENPISEEDLDALINKKLGRYQDGTKDKPSLDSFFK